MAEEIGFENGRNSNFQWLVTLILTLDPAIRHTVVHHSSTSTYIPNFIQIEEILCGWTDGHFSPSNIIRSTFGSRPKNQTLQLHFWIIIILYHDNVYYCLCKCMVIFQTIIFYIYFPLVLSQCWLGDRKGNWPVNKWMLVC